MAHRASAGLLMLALLACAEPMTPPDPEPLPPLHGAYTLETVNGFEAGELGWVLQIVPPEIIRLIGNRMHLTESGAFVDSVWNEFDSAPFGPTFRDTLVTVGTYAVSDDSTVTFTRDNGTSYTMRRRANELERFVPRQHVSAPLLDLTLVYRKH